MNKAPFKAFIELCFRKKKLKNKQVTTHMDL